MESSLEMYGKFIHLWPWPLTLKVPEELQLYGLYVYYVVHICDFGMLRVNCHITVMSQYPW